MERDQALEAAVSSNRAPVRQGRDHEDGRPRARSALDVVSTGALSLDVALGIGGLPRGRVCEIFGPESSGKTTLLLPRDRRSAGTGGLAAFIDAEHAWTRATPAASA